MGVIAKQSIYSTLITYLGLAVGIINIYLYVNLLEPYQKGIIDGLVSLSSIIVSIASFGITYAINKFLPYYKVFNKPGNNDLFYLIFRHSIIPFALITLLVFVFRDVLFLLSPNTKLLSQYSLPLYITSLSFFLYQIFSAVNIGYNQNIMVSFTTEIMIKLFNLAFILLLYSGLIDFTLLVYLSSTIFSILTVILIFNLYKNQIVKINKQKSVVTYRLGNKIQQFALVTWFANLFYIISQFIDSFIIMGLKGMSNFAYYSLGLQAIMFINAPQRSIINSSLASISESWRKNDIANLQTIYFKSANILLWFGGYIFFIILISMNDVFTLIRPEYNAAKAVIIILGISKMIDFVTGVNTHILNLSKKYWTWDLAINITVLICIIPINFFFVKKYGILGSAYSNIIMVSLFGIIKTTVLFRFLQLHPFTSKNLKLILVIIPFIATGIFIQQMPFTSYSSHFITLTAIGIKIFIASIIYLCTLYFLNVTYNLNRLTEKLLQKTSSVLKIKSK